MRITKWLSGIMIVALMISSPGVSTAAQAAEQAQTAVETGQAAEQEQAEAATAASEKEAATAASETEATADTAQAALTAPSASVEAEIPAEEKSSPAKAEEGPGEDHLVIILSGGDYGYFGSPSIVSKEYHPHKGDPFNPDAQPTAVSDRYLFAGWYSGIQGRGVQYTEETIIDEEMDGMNIYANWLPNVPVIPVMELDKVYALDVPSEGVLFSFTPSATTTYEMYTTENDPYESIANVRLLNDKLITVAESRSMDGDFNAIISTELTAGTTYYIEFSEVFGTVTAFNAIISRSDTVPVTFHANRSKYGEAYFDKDPDKTEKTVDIRKGTHLEQYASSGLDVDRDADVFFVGWSLDPDAAVGDDEILADGPTDVYAVYGQIKRIILDANGGSFPSLGTDVTQYTYRYYPRTNFAPRHEPESGDPDILFAGWADSAGSNPGFRFSPHILKKRGSHSSPPQYHLIRRLQSLPAAISSHKKAPTAVNRRPGL